MVKSSIVIFLKSSISLLKMFAMVFGVIIIELWVKFTLKTPYVIFTIILVQSTHFVLKINQYDTGF